MSTAAAIRYTAAAIEHAFAAERPVDDGAIPYRQAATDIIEWVTKLLRDRADALAAHGTQVARLRELATRGTAGTWSAGADGEQFAIHTDAEILIAKSPVEGVADYIAAVQPRTVIALLNAFDDPDAPTPDLAALEAAAYGAPLTPWTAFGIFLRGIDGEDLGWVHRSDDVDFVIAAQPTLILELCSWIRTARGLNA